MTQIRGTRPTLTPSNEHILANFEIYNAPRPLYGHINWIDRFVHGRFYVAIDPLGDYAAEYRSRTLANDGKLLEWIDDGVAFARQCVHYSEIYDEGAHTIRARAYIADQANREEIIQAYFRRVNGG